jgi:TPR repeat protein
MVVPVRAQESDAPQEVSDQEIKTFFRSGHPLKCAVGQAAQMQGDHETALWIFNTCARENNLFGVMSLALYYELGLGVPRSDERAAQLYRQAALHPDHAGYGKNGKYYYALALLQGRGVPQDPTEGLYWMREAARFGQREAVDYLSKLNRSARPVGVP